MGYPGSLPEVVAVAHISLGRVVLEVLEVVVLGLAEQEQRLPQVQVEAVEDREAQGVSVAQVYF